jgi:hypothetical protein
VVVEIKDNYAYDGNGLRASQTISGSPFVHLGGSIHAGGGVSADTFYGGADTCGNQVVGGEVSVGVGAGADSYGGVGRCQGSRSRRVARYIMAIWLGALFIEPDVLKSQSLGSRLQAILITAVVVAAFDVWFSRRMGLTIDERGITLHYAFHRKRVPWAKVQSFEWKRWHSPPSEWIWITLSGG